LAWLHEVVYLSAVTHISTNLAQRRVTSFVLHCHRSPIVEQSATWTAMARPDISSFHAETENTLLVLTWLQLRQ